MSEHEGRERRKHRAVELGHLLLRLGVPQKSVALRLALSEGFVSRIFNPEEPSFVPSEATLQRLDAFASRAAEEIGQLIVQTGLVPEEPNAGGATSESVSTPGDEAAQSAGNRSEARSGPPQVFISHSSKDHKFVHNLAADLKRDGIRAWVDEGEIKVGDRLRDKIERGIEQSHFMIVVLSKASTHRGWRSSRWVNVELDAAFIQQTETWRTTILPCRIEKCQIPALLRGLRYADFGARPYDEAYAELLRALGHTPNPPSVPCTITLDEVSALAAGVPAAIRSRAEQSLLRYEATFGDNALIRLLPDRPEWSSHFIARLKGTGLPLPRPPSSGGAPRAADLASHLSSLIGSGSWTSDAALSDLGATLPEAAPVVVRELLILERIKQIGGGIIWQMQVRLSRLLAPHADNVVLRAYATIIRLEHCTQSNSLVIGLVRNVERTMADEKQFRRWFRLVFGIAYDASDMATRGFLRS